MNEKKLDDVLSLLSESPEDAKRLMEACQLNQAEEDKLQEQSIDYEDSEVRSVIGMGLAKNRKEALELLKKAPF